ncbi:hypothetical protein [Streptococcus hyovaginalis]
MQIKEYIEFGEFNSQSWGMYLHNRYSPSPEEKEVIEDIPFMQGVLDFSMVLGERIFTNREIEYEFKLANTEYEERKTVERKLKEVLMMPGKNRLYDTHDNNYYWLGKCKSVHVKHDPIKRNFIATITFDCYPFMFTLKEYFDDVWDTFDFDTDVAGFTRYVVDGVKDIILINTSSVTVGPEITTSDDMTITSDGQSYYYRGGSSVDLSFGLKPGINHITIKGNGIVKFRWSAEVMG